MIGWLQHKYLGSYSEMLGNFQCLPSTNLLIKILLQNFEVCKKAIKQFQSKLIFLFMLTNWKNGKWFLNRLL